MLFTRESCPCGASSRGLRATEGEEDHQVRRSGRIFWRVVFPGRASDGLGLKPCQAMIHVRQSHLFCRMPLVGSLSGPGSTLFSHFFRGTSVSGLRDHLSHQPFEFSEVSLPEVASGKGIGRRTEVQCLD